MYTSLDTHLRGGWGEHDLFLLLFFVLIDTCLWALCIGLVDIETTNGRVDKLTSDLVSHVDRWNLIPQR
jgi:hypothetical protein